METFINMLIYLNIMGDGIIQKVVGNKKKMIVISKKHQDKFTSGDYVFINKIRVNENE